MNHSNAVDQWDESIWQEINEAVAKEIAKVRIGPKVFPTIVFETEPEGVPNEVIDFATLSIEETGTKGFVRISQEFSLTSSQVHNEPHNKICKTLAKTAAKTVADIGDKIYIQGKNAPIPANVQVDSLALANEGLLGVASDPNADDNDPNEISEPIDVPPVVQPRPGLVYGENVFSAVAEGITKLIGKTQAPDFALLLPITVFADTFVPPSPASLITTAERIKPLVEGGFYGTGSLPQDKGLLVALAGDPTILYVGSEATAEFVRQDRSRYFFQVVETLQFNVSDKRAFVRLNFL